MWKPKAPKREKEWIDTCFICNGLSVVSRHHDEQMCNTCYELIKRMRRKHLKETGEEWTREEFLTKAVSRRAELKESGKWEKRSAKHMPNIRIGISK